MWGKLHYPGVDSCYKLCCRLSYEKLLYKTAVRTGRIHHRYAVNASCNCKLDISEHDILIMLSGLKCYTVFNFTINFALRIMEQGMVNKLHKRCVTHQLINYANTMSIHQSERHYKVRWNYECFQQFLNPSRVDCSLLQIVNTQ